MKFFWLIVLWLALFGGVLGMPGFGIVGIVQALLNKTIPAIVCGAIFGGMLLLSAVVIFIVLRKLKNQP